MLSIVAQLELLDELTPVEQRNLYLELNTRLSGTKPPKSDMFLAMKLATLMEMTTTLTGFSAGPADTSKFEVPGSYKQVESPTAKRGR